MDIYALTDQALIKRIGSTIRQRRLSRNLSQKRLAEQTGVSLSSIAALERGSSVSLSILIPVLRALNELDQIRGFIEEPPISPIAYARMLDGEKIRRRASARQQEPAENKQQEW